MDMYEYEDQPADSEFTEEDEKILDEALEDDEA